MTSAISTTGLDTDFPVAGRDNDSQGFRDNFLNIKTNLDSAASEITALQAGVARLDTDNNFDGNEQTNMLVNITSYKTSNEGATGGGDFETAAVQTWTLSTGESYNVTVALNNFPIGNYGTMRCIVKNTDTGSHSVTFTAVGYTGFYTDGNVAWTSKTIELEVGEIGIVDAFSPDGDNMYLNYIGTFS
tara:strand:+ start:4719 stop:5282 length:564 start_codon:yes stop_codon:yes gene_type:complete